MKKKLLLAVLPALLVLSACNPLSSYAAAGTKVNQFAEDTIAHEDIFGEAQEVEQFEKPVAFQRNPGEDITAPKIGYQIKYDSGENTLAIRFLAAVKDLNVKAYWRRGVAGPDGNPINSKVFSNTFEPVTKYYKSLTAGDETITAGEAPYADYEGFVVYTIYGIPYNATNKQAYVAAYVNLVGDENGQDDGAGGTYNKHSNSVGLAVSIERKSEEANEPDLKNVFTFDPTYTGHFLQGTINGVVYDGGTNGLYRESANTPSGNFAWYENVPLETTDSFASFYYSQDSTFEFFGSSFFDKSAGFFKKSTSISGYVSPILQGSYKLSVSSGNANHIYTQALSYNDSMSTIKAAYTNIYLIPNDWNVDGAFYIAHFFDGADADVQMTDSNSDGIYEAVIPSGANKVLFCRMGNSGSSGHNWYINGKPVWNKTSDLNLEDRYTYSGPLGALTISAAGDYNQQWLGGVSDIIG